MRELDTIRNLLPERGEDFICREIATLEIVLWESAFTP